MLLTSLDSGVLALTLNRPDKRNALDAVTIAALAAALERAELDPAVRVVAVRGAGKDFCAGADLAELLASADQSLEQNQQSAGRLGAIYSTIRRLPHPVVAVVHGRALAGGAGLATACDLVIAGHSAQFGYPEVQRGFVPAMVMTMLRRVAGEKRGFDLVATGRLLSASEALDVGLVSRVVPDAELESSAATTLAQLAGSSPSALALIKRLFYELDGRSFDDGIALGARVNALVRAHPDFRTAIAAFLQR
jgi:methylglutaconyl-CoA hydratase